MLLELTVPKNEKDDISGQKVRFISVCGAFDRAGGGQRSDTGANVRRLTVRMLLVSLQLEVLVLCSAL